MAQAANGRRAEGGEVRLLGLARDYGEVHAVRDMTLTAEPGEFLTLLGASGSGKTTTLMMIAGFVAPSHGEILIDGRSVIGKPPDKRNLGVVFQSYALFPHMTVAENVGFPLRMRRLAKSSIRARVEEALLLVQLAGYGERRTHELSGGQQQRVALARALVFRPPVLLMDEPLGALDRKLREHMQLEIKRIQRSLGLTVIYVTHDQGEALTMSDRIVIMEGGRTQQIGTPQEVYERPATAYVAEFLGESNFIEGLYEGTEAAAALLLPSGERIHVPGGAFRRGQRLRAMVRPESLRLGAAASQERVNVVIATIEEAEYHGQSNRYLARWAGQRLILRAQRHEGMARCAPGQEVMLHWPAGASVLFPLEEEGT